MCVGVACDINDGVARLPTPTISAFIAINNYHFVEVDTSMVLPLQWRSSLLRLRSSAKNANHERATPSCKTVSFFRVDQYGATPIEGDAMSDTHEDGGVLDYTVAYADTDAAGVIYHGRYLEMAERSRNNMIWRAGFPYSLLQREYDVIFVVHKVNAVYYASGFLEDQLHLRTHLASCEAARSIWVTEVLRGTTMLASVSVEMVAIRASTRSLCRHPQAILDTFSTKLAKS
jgi:acyl-CoA thioester hydrolase